MSQNPSDYGHGQSEASWAIARQLAVTVGPVPGLYLEVIRVLWKAHLEGLGAEAPIISDEVLVAVRLIERASKLRVPIYFAATSLYPERFESNTDDDVTRAVVGILRPGLFAVVLILLYYHRRLNKLLGGVKEWEALSQEYISQMEAGFAVGLSAPKLREAEGMLIAGIRIAGLAALLVKDPDNFASYRRSAKKPWNIEYEQTHWGCDHGQIAAILLHDMCFHKYLYPLALVFQDELSPTAQLEPQLRVWRHALELIDRCRVIHPGSIRSEVLSELGLDDKARFDMVSARLKVVAEGVRSFGWMLRSSKDADEEPDIL